MYVIRPDPQNYISHVGIKGTTWRNRKYIRKENGKYIYPKGMYKKKKKNQNTKERKEPVVFGISRATRTLADKGFEAIGKLLGKTPDAAKAVSKAVKAIPKKERSEDDKRRRKAKINKALDVGKRGINKLDRSIDSWPDKINSFFDSLAKALSKTKDKPIEEKKIEQAKRSAARGSKMMKR